jgi:hypothetical protein
MAQPVLTAWVCVVCATSRESASKSEVCTTMKRRPTCSGWLLPSTCPAVTGRKKLLFDSMVLVVAPGGRFKKAHTAERVGQAHEHAAVEDAGGGAAFGGPGDAADDLGRRRRLEGDPEPRAEGHELDEGSVGAVVHVVRSHGSLPPASNVGPFGPKGAMRRGPRQGVFENLGWALVAPAGGAFALLTTLLVDQAR